jgi:hypothetical protein
MKGSKDGGIVGIKDRREWVSIKMEVSEKPITADLNNLKDADYYIYENELWIRANEINKTTITYICPFCNKTQAGVPKKI